MTATKRVTREECNRFALRQAELFMLTREAWLTRGLRYRGVVSASRTAASQRSDLARKWHHENAGPVM
ncbi:hypothetical protein SAMN05421548_13819 [Paraburkholderia lycopersici]|uniref:Uncharacterized protein n=1 Tax=Paraburkholderia lycopersici TaxID=416944 RepID=A0A1G7B8S6_9BURK|nr:hypothetical protein SAMN05421548_13819 [Paraburkholderia lycopersici]